MGWECWGEIKVLSEMSDPRIPILAALITASAGFFVAMAVWILGRRRDQRNLTIELHKQYYAPEMGKARLNAAKLVMLHCDNDWSLIDPYKLSADEIFKDGYSEVVRYFHRFGVLYKEREIRKSLARRLLAREYGYWYHFLFA